MLDKKPAPELTLAVISMTSTDAKDENIKTAERLVRQAKSMGADWVQLPEMWPYLGGYDHVHTMAEKEGGPLFRQMASLAKELGIVLFAGSVGERPGDDLPEAARVNAAGQKRVYNTSYVFGRDGSLLAKYRKTHLFNLLGEDGLPRYCESDGYIPGDNPTTVLVDGWRVGLSICYDLRFPEFYTRLAREDLPEILAVPSAFTKGTGQAHWELLLRARAVERQCYVFAANQTGTHAPDKESFGHSMIVDPWGSVLANTHANIGVATAKLSWERLLEVRTRLPALRNRRHELYT